MDDNSHLNFVNLKNPAQGEKRNVQNGRRAFSTTDAPIQHLVYEGPLKMVEYACEWAFLQV